MRVFLWAARDNSRAQYDHLPSLVIIDSIRRLLSVLSRKRSILRPLEEACIICKTPCDYLREASGSCTFRKRLDSPITSSWLSRLQPFLYEFTDMSVLMPDRGPQPVTSRMKFRNWGE